jgi:V8-like Glu-specific endopeptidase
MLSKAALSLTLSEKQRTVDSPTEPFPPRHVADSWGRATARVKNPAGESGSAFMIGRETARGAKVFAVTTKHFIGNIAQLRATGDFLEFGLNSQPGRVGAIRGETISLPNPQIFEHPDPEVDVAAVDVTEIIIWREDVFGGVYLYDDLPKPGHVHLHQINAGDPVAVVGYPQGFRQGDTFLPLVRRGALASTPGLGLVDEQSGQRMRAFLVDGAVIPGSSGSPVVIERYTTASGWPIPIGIIAATHTVEVPGGGGRAFSGLGVAFEIWTVRETIDVFYAVAGRL